MLPVAVMAPAVTLPVVDMTFDPKAAKNVATLALPYTPGIGRLVSWLPSPKI